MKDGTFHQHEQDLNNDGHGANVPLKPKQNIGIFGGINRGGLGDLASNLYVAKQMAALGPHLDVFIVLHDEIIPDYQKLVFNLDSNATIQKRYGLTFIRGSAINKMRFNEFMGFSMAQPEMKGVILDRLGRRVKEDKYRFYGEYGGEEESTDWFSTGLHALYISPEKPPVLPREELNQQVQDCTGIDIRNKRIAFRYKHAFFGKPLEDCIANEPDVVIFSDHLPTGYGDSQIRCEIVTPALDLFLSEQLIANADFPVMVTGDVSLSMALEHEKPFVYRGQYWKRPFGKTMARFFGVEDSGRYASTYFSVASDNYGKFREMRQRLSIHNSRLSDLYDFH